MRVCPKCHYIDRSHWRQNRWRTNVDFLKYLEYPEDIDPKISEKLLAGHPVATDKLYAYQKSTEVIERVLLEDYLAGGRSAFHIPREKVTPMDPYQHRLLEEKHP